MGALAPATRGVAAETMITSLAAVAVAFHLSISSQPLQSARVLASCAAGLLAFLFCARLARLDGTAVRAGWIGLAAAGTLLAVHGLWQSLAGFERLAAEAGLPEAVRTRLASGRAVATLGVPGALAGFFALSLPITAALAWRARASRGAAFAAGAAAVLQAAALIATRSVAAPLSLALAAALVAWCRAPSTARRRLAIVSLAGGGAIAAALTLWRLASYTVATEGAGPLVLRAGNWRAALAMVADRPLFGGGLGCFGILFPAYRDWTMNESRFAHNTWLQLAAEAGVPAALAAGALAIWLAWRLVRRDGRLEPAAPAAAIACVGFLIHNGVDFTFYLPSVALPFFCLAGFEVGRGRRGMPHGDARAARLIACAALAVFALLLARADAQRDAAREAAAAGSSVAIEAARAAVRLDPIDPESHDLLSRLLLARAAASQEAGLLSEAEAHAARAVDLDDRTPGHWNQLGRVRLARADRQGAYIALHRAAELYPIQLEYRQDRDAVAAMLAGSGERAR